MVGERGKMEKVKKERKKLKKGAVIAIVLVAVIVALSGAGLLWYFWDMIFNPPENSDLGQYYGLFGYAPDTEEETSYADYSDRFATFSTEIERGMAEEATDEDKVLAAYIIYRIACLANETATMKAKYTIGTGSASGAIVAGEEGTPVEVGCSMNLTASYYTLLSPFPATPSIEEINSGNYEKYEVSEEYTQIPAGAVTATNETFAKIGEPVLRIVLPFARRGILTPTNKIVWEGDQDSSVITPTGVTGKFAVKDSKFKKMTSEDMIESGVSREYPLDWGDEYGLSAKDLSIHIINPETIIPSSVVITKNIGSDVTGRNKDYYSVHFEVDTETGRGTTSSATYYAEQLYLSQAPTAFTDFLSGYNLYYSALKVEMTVFENGYIRTWGTDETWVMSGNLGDISATVTSQNDSTEAFCYDYDTIMQGFSNRYFGNLEGVDLPKEELPFYAELQNYPPQEYGTYR
jgi:hypothetical protein